ncbi:hypothetical protein LWI28_000195 [Acer negundo]|uniref:DUF4220 domain-containing protein n=1 Tax=Acer negundo TaxID=4023 RepID=A0AAD5NI65_ACENE|nr:hypothetical protein LWI28_000195 [Acer negundo]
MQTLWGVYYIVQRNFIRKWVQSFTRLRKLKLIGWPSLASEEIAEWISKLTSLETLKLVSISDDSKLASSITLCTTLKVHHKLQKLYLKKKVRPWIRRLVWSAYTAADSIATFALGILSSNITEIFDDNRARYLDSNVELTTFWAQFLLLHLGGADSITAYALEDNALWMRHLLGLVTQTCGIVYISP